MVQGVLINEEGCLVNTNPATGEVISKVKCTTPEQLEEIVTKAKTSQKEWRTRTCEDRVRILKDCIKELSKASDQMVKLITQEMGKPILEAEEEVGCAVNDQEEYFNVLLQSIKPKKYGKNNTVVRHPYGVVAIMSPWNFPVGEIMLYVIIC